MRYWRPVCQPFIRLETPAISHQSRRSAHDTQSISHSCSWPTLKFSPSYFKPPTFLYAILHLRIPYTPSSAYQPRSMSDNSSDVTTIKPFPTPPCEVVASYMCSYGSALSHFLYLSLHGLVYLPHEVRAFEERAACLTSLCTPGIQKYPGHSLAVILIS